MTTLSKTKFFKLCQILSVTFLFSSSISSVFAEETDFYNFPTGEQEGGGVRGEANSCSDDVSYPIPIVPQDTKTLTASASPKLFFDASNTQPAIILDLILLNQDDQIVYQDMLKTNENSGLIGLDLFDRYNSNELKINHDYHWYLVQQCDNLNDPKIVANGALERIQLEERLTQKIAAASTTDKISIYQEANIWHEAIDSLTQLKCNTFNTEEIREQLTPKTNFTDLSAKSLDNYCPANLKP